MGSPFGTSTAKTFAYYAAILVACIILTVILRGELTLDFTFAVSVAIATGAVLGIILMPRFQGSYVLLGAAGLIGAIYLVVSIVSGNIYAAMMGTLLLFGSVVLIIRRYSDRRRDRL
ncbi:MAG: hypothetical protein ACR2OE_05665 [Thermomicrobiales bacterium]